jgi:hypothetical protein
MRSRRTPRTAQRRGGARRIRTRPPITSLADFVDAIRELRQAWTDENWVQAWYRGHADAGWPLTPKYYRVFGTYDYLTEGELRDDFQRRGRQLVTTYNPRDDWEWYFTMQHHGAPTRLLDWTDGALIALYFALCPHPKHDAAVWVLDPFWLNRRCHDFDAPALPEWDGAKPYLPPIYSDDALPGPPLAIDPPHVTQRFSVQRSHFTIFGDDASEQLAEFGSEEESRLVKLTVARRAIAEMRYDLHACGITENTVYPDLEGLSRELTDLHRPR